MTSSQSPSYDEGVGEMSKKYGRVYVTNGWAAERMGYSPSGVSLLRSGNRNPTLETMEAVEKAFGWTIEDQVRNRRRYSEKFEQVILAVYAREQERKKREQKR